MFYDRKDAGSKLAEKLLHYKDENPVVLGIARGGIEIGFEIAKALNAQFDAVITRKLPFPDNPEAGFGAVAEDGGVYLHPHSEIIPKQQIEKIKAEQIEEIKRRAEVIRKNRALPTIKNRTVILADDGIAMGSTMKASIALCRSRNCAKVVVAAPVAGPIVKNQMQDTADDAVILETPSNFRAVAQVYRNY